MHMPSQRASAMHMTVALATSSHLPLHLPSHLALHWPVQVPVQVPLQLPSPLVPPEHVPSHLPEQVPAQVPVHVAEQVPWQSACTVAEPSQVAVPLQVPWHFTLISPPEQRASIAGSVQLTSALHPPSQLAWTEASTLHTAGLIFSVIVPAAESFAVMAASAAVHAVFTSSSLGFAGAVVAVPPAVAMAAHAVARSARNEPATVTSVLAATLMPSTFALRSPSQPSPLAASEHPEAPSSRAAESGATTAVIRVIFLI
jgi:hypothetical protein